MFLKFIYEKLPFYKNESIYITVKWSFEKITTFLLKYNTCILECNLEVKVDHSHNIYEKIWGVEFFIILEAPD